MDDNASKPPFMAYRAPGSDGQRVLGPFRDLLDANMARNLLSERGIPSEMANDNTAALLGPIYGAAYGGLFLVLDASDADTARSILGEVDARRIARRDAQSPACRHCQQRPSTPVVNTLRWWALGLIAASMLASCASGWAMIGVLLGLILLAWPLTPQWKCLQCGKRFNAPKPDVLADAEEDDAEGNDAEDQLDPQADASSSPDDDPATTR